MDYFDKMLWAYRAVFKQTDVGGGSILARFIARERTVILYGNVGPNDYAADRTISARIVDKNDAQIGRLTKSSPYDNESFPIPWAVISGITPPNAVNQFQNVVVLGKGDELVITAAGLDLNEEVTIALRALITKDGPTVSTAVSGGTVTITETYNEVI